jgi:hypothetical protein
VRSGRAPADAALRRATERRHGMKKSGLDHRHVNGIHQELDQVHDEKNVSIVDQTPTTIPYPLIPWGRG